MFMETRRIGGFPSVVFVPTPEEAKMLDKFLGDCGAKPIELRGYIKMAEGYGPSYVSVWNPELNKGASVPLE